MGVGSVSKNATYSNIASLVQDIAEISRDPETIVAQAPDVLVTSPFYPAEAIEALSKTGIPVVQTELKHDPKARINSILLMGYIFGEEERAIEFAAEVSDRHESLVAVTGKAGIPSPRCLRLHSTPTSCGSRAATPPRAASLRLPVESTWPKSGHRRKPDHQP